jgi:hypothetical protein
MWCRHCQQDVPVVRQSVGGPACPRCRASLSPGGEGGVDLTSLDPKPALRTAPIDPWVLEADAFELRRIGRKLRPCVRTDAACAAPAGVTTLAPTAAIEPPISAPQTPASVAQVADDDRTTRGSAASVAADSGFLATLLAAATIAAQHYSLLPAEYLRWGVIGAGIGGAVFAIGVLRLATHAWRHGRELQSEVVSLRSEVTRLRDVHTQQASERQSFSSVHPRPNMIGARTSAASRGAALSSHVA